ITLAVLEVADVLMIWNFSVPVACADDAPAGTASHNATAAAAMTDPAAVAIEMIRFTVLPSHPETNGLVTPPLQLKADTAHPPPHWGCYLVILGELLVIDQGVRGSLIFQRLVQSALGDILHDPVRDQVPDRLSLSDPPPAPGRRNRQGGDLHQAHLVFGQPPVGEPVTRPGSTDEVGQREQFVHVLPGHHPGQRVGAGDEEELRVRPALRAQVTQRSDRVGRARAVDVQPADRKSRVRRRGDHRHQVAIFGRGYLPALLLPRLAGGHENNLVKREDVPNLAGRDEVAVMDGVERPPHHPDPDLAVSLHPQTLATAWPPVTRPASGTRLARHQTPPGNQARFRESGSPGTSPVISQ